MIATRDTGVVILHPDSCGLQIIVPGLQSRGAIILINAHRNYCLGTSNLETKTTRTRDHNGLL